MGDGLQRHAVEGDGLQGHAVEGVCHAHRPRCGLLQKSIPCQLLKASRGFEGSDGDHLEVFLAGRALWASPVHGHVFPFGPGRDAMLRVSCGFVVDPAANQAHPSFVFHHSVAIRESNRMI